MPEQQKIIGYNTQNAAEVCGKVYFDFIFDIAENDRSFWILSSTKTVCLAI